MATLIRREDVPPGGAVCFEDVEARAARILAAAREQARALLDDAARRARIRAEEERRAAHEAGRAEGRALGREQAVRAARDEALAQAKQDLDRLAAALRSAFDEFEGRKRNLLARAESGLIELAVAIARRVCKSWAEASPAAAEANVRALLERCQHADDAVLHVNPAEYEHIQVLLTGLERAGDAAHVTLRADPQVTRGGCTLHSTAGSMDADLAVQLDRIAAELCPWTQESAGEARDGG